MNNMNVRGGVNNDDTDSDENFDKVNAVYYDSYYIRNVIDDDKRKDSSRGSGGGAGGVEGIRIKGSAGRDSRSKNMAFTKF